MSHKTFQVFKDPNKVLLAAIGLIAWASTDVAKAVIILPGQTLPSTGVTATPGPLVFDTGNVPFTGTDALNNVAFTGLLDTKVIADAGTGGLDFIYQFSNNANSPDAILHLSATSFSGYFTDADYLAGSGASHPGTVERDAANGGDTIDFSFTVAQAVLPGSNSAELVVKTNATSFTNGTVSIQDGGNVSINAPTPASVPEPATLSIAGFALCALGMRRRKVVKN